ncbi:tail collar domain [Rhizobium subbaraonis]|uniref:Tail collar domain n=1 Tax=Rhizobium subbaraonis TaxID=908946 RepID=A0A285UDY9_9HYPH|nr:tail fiber protein [Rhizobium subbaraonis]SOC40100.1 tail collar domain [Rhizobium subbaraonis]
MSSIFEWSRIAANNANADSSINWAEGQPPSTVNNSARVMMQRIKELLDDLGGVASATGTANGIAVSAPTPFSALANGLRVAFRASNNNSAATSLNVNSLGSKPVVKFTTSGETALSGGEVKIGGIYEVVYSTLLNGGAGAWLLLNPTPLAATVEVPPGAVSAFARNSAPSGWLKCNGAAVSRTTYAGLFSAIGTAFGAGNRSTTFNVPELRGEFIRGWADGRSVDTGRVFGSTQAHAFDEHTHTGTTASNSHSHTGTTSSDSHSHTGTTNSGGSHNHTVSGQTPASTQSVIDPGNQILYASDGANSRSTNTSTDGSHSHGFTTSTDSHSHSFTTNTDTHSHSFTTNAAGGSETRPRNVALLYCIKT